MITQTTARAQVARQSADMDRFYILMQEAGQLQGEADSLMTIRNRTHTAYQSSYYVNGTHSPITAQLYALYTAAADEWLHVQTKADNKRNLARSYAR